jgi:hypothetical protein
MQIKFLSFCQTASLTKTFALPPCYDSVTMKLPRISRAIAALIAVFSLLFAQLAVAAYACPQLAMAVMSAQAEQGDMPGCTGMADTGQPGLCQAHCASGQQSLDAPVLPPVAPFAATGLVAILALSETTGAGRPAASQPPLLARATAPPLAIRHCCFRI